MPLGLFVQYEERRTETQRTTNPGAKAADVTAAAVPDFPLSFVVMSVPVRVTFLRVSAGEARRVQRRRRSLRLLLICKEEVVMIILHGLFNCC